MPDFEETNEIESRTREVKGSLQEVEPHSLENAGEREKAIELANFLEGENAVPPIDRLAGFIHAVREKGDRLAG